MAKVKEEKQGTEAVLAELEKKYGLGKANTNAISVVRSGSYMIDRATNLGGYPKGKLIEIFGQESSGKSTIVLHAIAQYQKQIPNKKVALIDYEYSFDLVYAKALGVDVDALLVYQPDNQEQGYDMILGLLEKEIVSLVVIDSHTAAIPQKIIEGEMGDATMGLAARNNSKFLGKVKGLLDKSGATMLAVSQTRVNIGGMGDTNVPTGGNAWKFYADMRFKVWKSLDKEGQFNITTLDVIKNKCAKPFGKAEFNINWGTGIDNEQEILDLAVGLNIVKKSGSWFSYGDMKIGQGSKSVKELFRTNPEFYDEVVERVKNHKKVTEEELASVTLPELMEAAGEALEQLK